MRDKGLRGSRGGVSQAAWGGVGCAGVRKRFRKKPGFGDFGCKRFRKFCLTLYEVEISRNLLMCNEFFTRKGLYFLLQCRTFG